MDCLFMARGEAIHTIASAPMRNKQGGFTMKRNSGSILAGVCSLIILILCLLLLLFGKRLSKGFW